MMGKLVGLKIEHCNSDRIQIVSCFDEWHFHETLESLATQLKVLNYAKFKLELTSSLVVKARSIRSRPRLPLKSNTPRGDLTKIYQ